MITLWRSAIAVLSMYCCFACFAQQDYKHLIIYGQSLSDGFQSYPALSVEPHSLNRMIGNQVWINSGNSRFDVLQPLRANISIIDQNRNFAKTRKDGARCENPVVGMVNHLNLLTGDSFIASSTGYSGRSIEQLSKHSQHQVVHYNDFIKCLNSGKQIAMKEKFGIEVPAIVWMQGEYNYQPDRFPGIAPGTYATVDKNEYKKLLVRLKDDMQTDVKAIYQQSVVPLFITYQTGCQYLRGFDQSISMAQLDISNQYSDVVCAGPVYPMTDRGGHLDPNGYRWFGEMLGKVYYRSLEEGKPFVPLQPVKIRKKDAFSLAVEFFVPYPPLTFDTELVQEMVNYGFVLRDRYGEKRITNITIEGNRVILKCSLPLTGDVEVAYAGESAGGHGNLRDSDPAVAFTNYTDLDAKSESGAFVFERDASETSLRPLYEPRDKDGVIYNKSYPLYNFATHFYYKLKEGESVLTIPGKWDDPLSAESPVEEQIVLVVTESEISVRYSSGKDVSSLELYDLNGRLIRSVNKSVMISPNEEGIFILRITPENGQPLYRKVLVRA